MRELYRYEIFTIENDGLWKTAFSDHETFTRDPKSIARALLERWIIGNRDKLTGGERILVYGRFIHPRDIEAKVQVRVYRVGSAPENRRPIAVAYLGHSERDFPTPVRSAGRLRRRLRMPRPRTSDAGADELQPAGGTSFVITEPLLDNAA